MSTEYGIFGNEGCFEGGFYSQEEAQVAIAERYAEEENIHVAELCPDHDENKRDTCEDCNSEDSEEAEHYAELNRGYERDRL